MPIIANNMIVGNQKVEHKVKIKPVQPSETPLKPLEEVSMVARTNYDQAKHGIVIIDGKEKKISRHSQYILDMLTIDND